MKIPISKRLLCCAEMIPPGARVADIGCDHGYLGAYLVQKQLASRVICCDLRLKPLERAQQNACRFGVLEQLDFRLGSGLERLKPEEADVFVFAGMGGELISQLLDGCSWICHPRYTLILQPQASGNDLRRWLGEHGFSIGEERLVADGRFLYSAMRAQFGQGKALTPGQQYVSEAVLRNDPELLRPYLRRVCKGLQKAVSGLQKSRDIQRLQYYETALAEVEEVIRRFDNGNDDFGLSENAGADRV